jgi:predicted dehydrogenase
MSAINAVIIGAGGRGTAYSKFAFKHPNELDVTAVADPLDERRHFVASRHDIPPENCFVGWKDLLAQGKMADALINCTMDRMHMESTLAALEAGYDVLLEKPMSPILEENVRLVQVAEEKGRLLQICHVLRYAPFWQKLREIVQSGRLGRIISIDHRENLVYWHMAHSYVRGNWRNLATSAPMILAKCCHDLDILYWIHRKKVVWLNSFGSLIHFRPEYAPEGATERCTDGCPAADNCKYYAPRLYVRDIDGWPWNALTFQLSEEARYEALKAGPFSRCVYHSDNDVVDHQTVNMELEDGTTVTLTMQGQGNEECRTMRYDGTKATLYAKFSGAGHKISIHDHLAGEVERFTVPDRDESGHGGGDFGVVRSFVNAMKGEPDDSLTSARESLESHLLAFAAEESRLNHSTIYMPDYREKVEGLARERYEK